MSSLTNVIAIATEDSHTIALDSNGTVWTWGQNTYGQLGDGTTTDIYTPVQVIGLTGITAIASGDDHTIALKQDGTVWTWGYNFYGQLGDATTANRNYPVQVFGLTGVIAIAGGSGHTIALKSAPVVSNITVLPAIASVVSGSTQTFTAITKDQDGNAMTATITWSSSNHSVGTIASTGLFTALAAGATTITAESGIVNGSATVTVNDAKDTLSIRGDMNCNGIHDTGDATLILRDIVGLDIPRCWE